MTKHKRTILVSAAATLVVILGADMLLGSLAERKDSVAEKIADIASRTLTECLSANDSILCGVVSFKETGSSQEPETVIIARHRNSPGRVDDFSHSAERMAIAPRAVMQTATLTWLMDHHEVRQDSSRYCIDRLVMETDLRKGLFWYFDDFFGSSRAMHLPNLRLISDPELLAVTDGIGLLLSPDQIVNFYDIIANGGLRPRRRYYSKKQICREETATEIRQLLRKNVPDGTGKHLLKNSVPIAGKTGFGVMERGLVPGSGYIGPDQPVSVASFAGFFPADAPRYTMLISIIKKEDGAPETVKAMNLYQEIVERMLTEGLL